MKIINICLETHDLDYATALSKSLLQHSKFFSIKFNRSHEDDKEWDLLLTDDMTIAAERTVYLTEDPSLESMNVDDGRYILYKYQQVSRISNMLRFAHSDFSKSEMISDETVQTNIISICSSSGGSGCTSVAMGICQELARFHGKKVLYISLEEFESTDTYFPESMFHNDNITKYLYAILFSNGRVSCIPEEYMLEDEYGIFAFRPVRGRNPLRALTGNEFLQFINHITREKIFTDLILDCGNGLDDTIVSAYQISSNICHVFGKSPNYNRRANYLFAVRNKVEKTNLLGLLNVFNKYSESEKYAAESIPESDQTTFVIEDEPTSFESVNGRKIVSVDKVFGQGIRQLVQHLVLSGK